MIITPTTSIYHYGKEYLQDYYYVVVFCFFSTFPSVNSSIPVTIEQNVADGMVEITVLVNVSNKLNYV